MAEPYDRCGVRCEAGNRTRKQLATAEHIDVAVYLQLPGRHQSPRFW